MRGKGKFPALDVRRESVSMNLFCSFWRRLSERKQYGKPRRRKVSEEVLQPGYNAHTERLARRLRISLFCCQLSMKNIGSAAQDWSPLFPLVGIYLWGLMDQGTKKSPDRLDRSKM